MDRPFSQMRVCTTSSLVGTARLALDVATKQKQVPANTVHYHSHHPTDAWGVLLAAYQPGLSLLGVY
jgi:hypothetical protein